jgi:excisionase family DNA binding protein
MCQPCGGAYRASVTVAANHTEAKVNQWQMLGRALIDSLTSDDLAALAGRLGPHLGASLPWLDAEEAAEYIRCPVSRIRKLTMTSDLPCHRDGRRVLYRRDELDGYVRAGGARTP